MGSEYKVKRLLKWTAAVGLGVLAGFIVLLTVPVYSPSPCPPGWLSRFDKGRCGPSGTTMALANAKQVGMATQIYSEDHDQTLPIWSAGMGTPSAFDADRMYPSLLLPYSKSESIWENPRTDKQLQGLRNAFAYNFWGLGGFSQCASPSFAETSQLCNSRSTDRFAEFAHEKYNRPASLTEIESPKDAFMFTEGHQLARPPQFGVAFPDADAMYVGVWGSEAPFREPLSGPAGPSRATGAVSRLQSGVESIRVSVAGGVARVPTAQLYGQMYSTPGWRGTLTNNAGWSRDSASAAPGSK
jgi:hypothetical protein